MQQTNNQAFINRNQLQKLAHEVLSNVNAYYDPKYQELMRKIQYNYPSEEKEVYGQDWSAYNKAQSREKLALIANSGWLLSLSPKEKKEGRKL